MDDIPKPTAISLFAGAGGMDLGFITEGFDVAWANDFDPAACETYAKNIGDHIVCGDISDVDLATIPETDIIFGGPPCQGFSVAGHMDPHDPRSMLVWEFVRVVHAKNPCAFVMENVRALGMLKKWAPLRDALHETFVRLGYRVAVGVLNAADFGVPQKRERVFFIGTREPHREPQMPEPTHIDNWLSTRDAITGLPPAGSPGNDGVAPAEITLARYPVLRRSPYAGMLVNGQGRPIDLEVPAPTMHASMGGNKTPIIDLDQLAHPDREPWIVSYRRGLDKGAGPSASGPPASWRRITVQEAARIQTFPDDFQFSGKRSPQFRQIGNAVPPRLAAAIARAVKPLVMDDIERSLRDKVGY